MSETYLTIATGLSGTPMLAYGDSVPSQQIWALVYYLESLVPGNQRRSDKEPIGEEQTGRMVVGLRDMLRPSR